MEDLLWVVSKILRIINFGLVNLHNLKNPSFFNLKLSTMKKTIIITLLQVITLTCFSQIKILPGDKSIDNSLLKSGTFTMGYSVYKNGPYVEIGNYITEISNTKQKIDIKTTLVLYNSKQDWTSHFVAEANSFKPISNKTDGNNRILTLNFGNEITGESQDKKTGK